MHLRSAFLAALLFGASAPASAVDLSLGAGLLTPIDALADTASDERNVPVLGTISAGIGLFSRFGIGVEYMDSLAGDEADERDGSGLYSAWLQVRSGGRLYGVLRGGATLALDSVVGLFPRYGIGAGLDLGANTSVELGYGRIGEADVVALGLRYRLF